MNETVKMNTGRRILSLIVSPGELMENIKARPVFLVPYLMAVVIGLIALVPNLRVSEMYTRELSHISIERYGVDHFDLTALAGEYGDIPMEEAMGAIMFVSQLGTMLIMPLFVGFFAALGLFVLSKIMRGSAKFGQMFSMYMHVYVIAMLGGLVVASLMALTGSLLDMTSLAAVFARDGNFDELFYNILSGIAVFPVWVAGLTFIGVKTLNGFGNVKAGIIAGIAYLVGLAGHIVTYMATWWMYDAFESMGAL